MTSPLDNTVTLDRALELIEARRVPIAPEVAGYLCLELAERASMQPGGLVPEGIFLGEEGSVAFVPRAQGEAPEVFVRALLRRLLDASGSRPAALWQVTSGQRPGAELLVRELEAALIPLNRMASRRSLARLAREVQRVTQGVGRNAPSSVRRPSHAPSKLPPPSVPPAPPLASAPPAAAPVRGSQPPSAGRQARTSSIDELLDALDAAPPAPASNETETRNELKAMAGLEPTPPPPAAHTTSAADDERPPTDEESEAIEALLVASVSGPQGRLAEAMRPSRPDLPAVPATPSQDLAPAARRGAPAAALAQTRDAIEPNAQGGMDDETSPPPRPLPKAPLRRSTPEDLRMPPAAGAGRSLAVALLFAFALGLGLVYWLRPEWMLGHKLTPGPAPQPSAATPPTPTRTCALRVVGAPAEAEILLLAGRAPLDVSPMPAGARIEFVGLLPEHAPKRAVVPAQANWSKDERGKARYELAFELAPSRKKNDPWPAAEPGTTVGGEGEPGTVHVVSSPPAAEVWLLFGSGAEALLDPVPCVDTEILVAAGTQLRTRVKIGASEFASDDGGKSTVTKDLRGGR